MNAGGAKVWWLAGTLIYLGSCQRGRYLEDFQPEPVTGGLAFYPPAQVTAGGESNFSPDLSPNGEYVFYTSDRTGNKDVWVKPTIGGFGRQVTRHSADDFAPVLSPDGKRLAFISRRADAAGDVHVLDLGFSFSKTFGNGEGKVLDILSPLTEDTSPSWFPDNKQLVFSARLPGAPLPALMIANTDDLKPEPLADLKGEQPDVSGDGQMVAFVRDGGIYIHHLATKTTEQITDGGFLQDSQPRFTADSSALVFTRYADDTNHDGKLNGDDHPTVWRIDLKLQKTAPRRENYQIVPLTSATFAAYSPQVRSPYLFAALKTEDGLDIFRLPEFGQIRAAVDLNEVQRQFDQRSDEYEKTYILRRSTAAFALAHKEQDAAECALRELLWVVQHGRTAEAAWVHAKILANVQVDAQIRSLADLAMIALRLEPLSYPQFTGEPTAEQKQLLSELLASSEQINKQADKAPRVLGQSLLIKAKILAAQRQFFSANQLLTEVGKRFAADHPLAAEAAYFAAVITPATADVDSAVKALREVAAKFPEQRDVARRAAIAAVALLDKRDDRLEALVSLRQAAKGVPLVPAAAHMRIAELFLAAGKEPVAANEFRQITDLYPESPEIMLEAARRLLPLDEKAERTAAAEATLKRLEVALAQSLAEYRAAAKELLIEFYLNRGEGLLKQKEAGLASKQYAQVISIDPLNISAHRGLIDAAAMGPKLDELTEHYEKEQSKHEGSAEWVYFYGYAKTYAIDRALGAENRLTAIREATSIVERARQLNGQLLQVHQTLGWLYLQQNFTSRQYYRSGSVLGSLSQRGSQVKDFVGFGGPDWRELAIEAYQNAFFLSRPNSIERAGLTQNLGQAYYSLHNYQKSLSYYLQRVRLLATIPMRDSRAEAILLERAGRSAFQTDELVLAEDLQRQALAAWERVNNEERVAYSLDALALTLRERGKYPEALTLYERLLRVQERLQESVNLIGTLSNLGYCAFMSNDLVLALDEFNKAEAALNAYASDKDKVAAEEAKKGDDSAIKVDLGGGASAAKGFDVFTRRLLILAFRAQVYEKMGRLDKALATDQERLKILQEASGENKQLIAESASLVANHIGEESLRAGLHTAARAAFLTAEGEAKKVGSGDHKTASAGELTNRINRARVALRLAMLQLLPPPELEREIGGLDEGAGQLRPAYAKGTKEQAKLLAASLELSAALRLTKGMPGDEPAAKKGLDEALAILTSSDARRADVLGTLLAYQRFRAEPLRDPEATWKALAAQGDEVKAFAALERWLASGGVLRSPTDRYLARQIFEGLISSEQLPLASPAGIDLVRRFSLMRLTDMAQRAGMDKARLQKLLSMKETAQVQGALSERDGILWVHRTLTGQLDWLLITKLTTTAGVARGPVSGQDAAAYSKALAGSTLESALPESGGCLYLVPDDELFELPWDQLQLRGVPLAQRHTLAYLPAIDLLPTYYGLRRMGKGSIGGVHESPPQAASLQAASPGRDVQAVALDGQAALLDKLGNYDLIHADVPLWLNDVEPQETTLVGGGQGSNAHRNDVGVRSLLATAFASTTAIIYANVQRPNIDLQASGEGHDGWMLLALAHASAGVPTALLVGDAKKADWPAFYQALTTKSVGEAQHAAQLQGHLLGYPGIPAADEVAFANSHLDKALDGADDAKADQDFGAAAAGYRTALYLAQRLQNNKVEAAARKGLVQTLLLKRDYDAALREQLKVAQRLKPGPKDGPNSDLDPVDYARALMDAATIAVKASQADTAAKLLDESEVIFTKEDLPDQLGKVWQYRAINLENQKRYDDTVKAYETAFGIYAKVKPEEAANQLLNLGNVYNRDFGDSIKALDYYEQASAAFKKLQKSDLYLSVLIDKSSTQMTIGDLDTAIATLEHDVVPMIDQGKQSVLWTRATQMLTNAYFRAGLYQQAKDLNEKTYAATAKVSAKVQRTSLQIDAIGMRAMIAAKLGNYKVAFADFQQAIATAQDFHLRDKLGILYNNYGFWAREYGAVDQSIDFFNTALRLDTDLKSRSAIAYDHRNMALSIILKGDFNRAGDLLRQALADSEELHLVYNAAYCQFGLGDIAMREKQWAEAEGFFRKALAVSLQGSMQDFIWRAHAGIGAASAQQGKTQDAANAYLAATKMIEKMSAGLKSEDSRSGFISDVGVQQVYADYATALMQLGQVEEAWTVSERGRARAFIDSLGAQRRQLPQQQRPHQQAALPSFSKVETIPKAELTQLLGPKTALVEYQVTTDHLLIWVIRDGGVSGKVVDISAKELLAMVRDYRELMQNYSSTDYLGKQLSDVLITPVAAALEGAERLAIVPHQVLHFLPFAALPLADGLALLDRFTTFYLESATLARFTLREPKGPLLPATTKVLALANATPLRDSDSDLPFAAKEVEVMGRYYPSRLLKEDGQATKAALLALAPHMDVLHIAAHGDFRKAAPAQSRLLLAPVDGKDGDLSVAEMFAMNSSADLVTLSACDTGLGRLSNGDEIVGMDRALFFSGANTVVSSLWRISDVASGVTMKRFYRYLAEGHDRAEAMRMAQLVVRRYFTHPAYWSAFRVVGSDR